MQLKKQFEENRDLQKKVLARILQVLKEARTKCEFPTALQMGPKLAIKYYTVYKSNRKGVSDVVVPLNGAYDFNNPLVAI